MTELTSEGLKLLSQAADLPSITVLGALEGTLWPEELVEVRELEGPSVIALLRSRYSGEYYINVVCSERCGKAVSEVVFSYLLSADSAWVVVSNPRLVDEMVGLGARIGETLALHLMSVDAHSFRQAPRPAGFDFSGLDEHDLGAASALLSSWGEDKAAAAPDMVMRGNAFGAWFENELVGIVGTVAMTSDWWQIGYLFVDPEFRGRGLGKYLASLVTSDALGRAREVFGVIEYDNAVARAILARIGYRSLSTSILVSLRSSR